MMRMCYTNLKGRRQVAICRSNDCLEMLEKGGGCVQKRRRVLFLYSLMITMLATLSVLAVTVRIARVAA